MANNHHLTERIWDRADKLCKWTIDSCQSALLYLHTFPFQYVRNRIHSNIRERLNRVHIPNTKAMNYQHQDIKRRQQHSPFPVCNNFEYDCSTKERKNKLSSSRSSTSSTSTSTSSTSTSTSTSSTSFINRSIIIQTVYPQPPILHHIETLSFSASGLHVFYHTGVARAMLDENIMVERIYATSGGTMSALYLLLDWRSIATLDRLLSVLPVDEACRKNETLRDFIWKRLIHRDTTAMGIELARLRVLRLLEEWVRQDPNTYKRVSGRLFIGVTRMPDGEKHVFSSWVDNEDLLGCIRASMDIPGVAGAPGLLGELWRDNRWIDGGFADLHPIECKNTITVSTLPIPTTSFTFQSKGLCKYSSSVENYDDLLYKQKIGNHNTYMKMPYELQDVAIENHPDISCLVDPYGARHVLNHAYYERLYYRGISDGLQYIDQVLTY